MIDPSYYVDLSCSMTLTCWIPPHVQYGYRLCVRRDRIPFFHSVSHSLCEARLELVTIYRHGFNSPLLNVYFSTYIAEFMVFGVPSVT